MDETALDPSASMSIILGPGLLFGLMLLAAIIGGFAARFVHIPRVVGFLVAGVGLRFALQALVDPAGGEEPVLESAYRR